MRHKLLKIKEDFYRKPRWQKILIIIGLFLVMRVILALLPQTELRLATAGYFFEIGFGKEPEARWERMGPGIIRLHGSWERNGSSTEQLRALLDQPVDTVRIVSSPGGETDAAIEDAELLLPIRPRIVVDEFCGSSCANYLLPIAREIHVRNGAVIAYHGTICEVAPSSFQCKREQAFWKKIPSGEKVSKLPLGLRKVEIPSGAHGWMPTQEDFITSGYPPVVFDWYPKPYTYAPGKIYIAPIQK